MLTAPLGCTVSCTLSWYPFLRTLYCSDQATSYFLASPVVPAKVVPMDVLRCICCSETAALCMILGCELTFVSWHLCACGVARNEIYHTCEKIMGTGVPASVEELLHLWLSSVRTSREVSLPIHATSRGAGRKESRSVSGVPSMRPSSETRFQLACDCSAAAT